MKCKFILCSVLTSFGLSNAYGVTAQISSAQAYLANLNANSQIIIENNGVESLPVALAPSKELKPKNQSELLKSLQSQVGLNETGVLDKETLNYIREFQKENGFNVTNTLDYNTWFALYEQDNSWKKFTVEQAEKIWQEVFAKQTMANTSKFVVVNIPTMTLTAYTWDGITATEVFTSKVVIGRPSTKTPLKDFQIVSLKYNPTWTPTDGILKRGAYRNGYLDLNWVKSHGLKVLNENNEVVPFSSVRKGVRYRFQQPAGERNALGILKFETNSTDNIYLHDTNEKRYFSYNTRAYSSGCIRVQDFKELANWLKNKDDVEEKLKNKNTFYERVDKTPVYFTYSQVVFYGETPLFAPDIYQLNNNTETQN